MEQLKRKQESIKDFAKLREKLGNSYDQVKEMRKHMKAIEGLMSLQEDSVKSKIEKLQKPLKIKLDSMDLILFAPDDAKGIVYDDDKLSSIIGNVSYYLSSSDAGVTSNSQALINVVKSKIDEFRIGMNKIIDEDWLKYKEAVEALGLKMFKEIKKVE
jgi:hypothetical protein